MNEDDHGLLAEWQVSEEAEKPDSPDSKQPTSSRGSKVLEFLRPPASVMWFLLIFSPFIIISFTSFLVEGCKEGKVWRNQKGKKITLAVKQSPGGLKQTVSECYIMEINSEGVWVYDEDSDRALGGDRTFVSEEAKIFVPWENVAYLIERRQ
ncbi:MAG: hypothetical protein GY915_08055 [bacterium]|nr:hypothetical protein [bacterium]